jgi:hypothetical protein
LSHNSFPSLLSSTSSIPRPGVELWEEEPMHGAGAAAAGAAAAPAVGSVYTSELAACAKSYGIANYALLAVAKGPDVRDDEPPTTWVFAMPFARRGADI